MSVYWPKSAKIIIFDVPWANSFFSSQNQICWDLQRNISGAFVNWWLQVPLIDTLGIASRDPKCAQNNFSDFRLLPISTRFHSRAIWDRLQICWHQKVHGWWWCQRQHQQCHASYDDVALLLLYCMCIWHCLLWSTSHHRIGLMNCLMDIISRKIEN